MAIRSFGPLGTTAIVSAGSSISALLKDTSADVRVRVMTAPGSPIAFFKFGIAGLTASPTDTPLLGGAIEEFRMRKDQTSIAFYAATSTTLYVTLSDDMI
jgi:hypothetical protein